MPLYRTQAEFLSSPALYRAFVGGRGSGKSWVACYDLIRKARPGRTYLLASPTYPMLFDSEAKTFAKLARELGVLRDLKLSAPASARLNNGAEILLRSADDPERLRGTNLSGAVLMEAALMHHDAYHISIACLREEGEQGWLTASTTPRGPSHWTHEVFATGRPDTAIFRAPTSANPFLPPEFMAKLQAQYGETNWARQELGGEFVQLEGSEFPGEWFGGSDLWFDEFPDDLTLKVVALDPSKGSDGKGKDYQAHVMVGVRVEEGRYVFYVDADLQREGVIPMCARSVELCRRFAATGRSVDSLIVEENGTMGLLPPAFEAACVKAGYYIPWMCRLNMENKESRIRAQVGAPLSRRQLRFRRTTGGRLLVGQLQSFPLDEHDDGPDALATAMRRTAELLGG